MTLNKNKKTEPIEPVEVEYFRELSERYLYWVSRFTSSEKDREKEQCQVIADNYRKLMNALTVEE